MQYHISSGVLPCADLRGSIGTTRVDLFFSRPSCQNRIEEAHTSDTLLKTVGMTRNMDMSAEREKGEQARATAQRAKDPRVESKEAPESRYILSTRGFSPAFASCVAVWRGF